MRLLDAPCKGCTDRHLGCHSRCMAYLRSKAKHDIAIKKEREHNLLEYSYFVRVISKSKEYNQQQRRMKN